MLCVTCQGGVCTQVAHILERYLAQITNDVERFIHGALFVVFLVIAPITAGIGLWIVWDDLSYAALPGGGLLFAMVRRDNKQYCFVCRCPKDKRLTR